MPFSKIAWLLAALVVAGVSVAQQAVEQTPEQSPVDPFMKEISPEYVKARIEQEKSRLGVEFQQEYVEARVKQHEQVANQIGQAAAQYQQQTLAQLAVSLNNQPSQYEKGTTQLPAAPKRTELFAIFVSFSMSDQAIREAFREAQAHDGELYFNGMHPDDAGIADTMKRIRAIMKDSDAVAEARFNPKAFVEFGIDGVPSVMYAKKGHVGVLHGTMNLSYLKEQMQGKKGLHDLGRIGAVKPVIERNLMDEIESRLSRIDGEALKKRAVDNYWKKQTFHDIPAASKDEEFYINPTIRVTADIVSPRGDVLAKEGQIVNPLDTVTTQNTYILFNATDERQTAWASTYMRDHRPEGIVMLMTSKLDSAHGWTHLGSLRKSFGREIYLIPKELADRFKLTGLPAVVTTDHAKGLFFIRQFAVSEVNP